MLPSVIQPNALSILKESPEGRKVIKLFKKQGGHADKWDDGLYELWQLLKKGDHSFEEFDALGRLIVDLASHDAIIAAEPIRAIVSLTNIATIHWEEDQTHGADALKAIREKFPAYLAQHQEDIVNTLHGNIYNPTPDVLANITMVVIELRDVLLANPDRATLLFLRQLTERNIKQPQHDRSEENQVILIQELSNLYFECGIKMWMNESAISGVVGIGTEIAAEAIEQINQMCPPIRQNHQTAKTCWRILGEASEAVIAFSRKLFYPQPATAKRLTLPPPERHFG